MFAYQHFKTLQALSTSLPSALLQNHIDGIDSELRAVNAAIKICQRIQEYKSVHNLSVGIGIHNGLVVTGYIGSEGRAQFTSIGNTVNFAARLCSNARSDEIWVSEAIYQSCSDVASFKYLGDVEFKGFQKPQKVYIVNYK